MCPWRFDGGRIAQAGSQSRNEVARPRQSRDRGDLIDMGALVASFAIPLPARPRSLGYRIVGAIKSSDPTIRSWPSLSNCNPFQNRWRSSIEIESVRGCDVESDTDILSGPA
jgi:hypothetical protein